MTDAWESAQGEQEQELGRNMGAPWQPMDPLWPRETWPSVFADTEHLDFQYLILMKPSLL